MKCVARVARSRLAESAPIQISSEVGVLMVVRLGYAVFALEDACNHAGAPLSKGTIEERCVICPMHQYSFDLATGELVAPRGLCGDQRSFPTSIEADEVCIWDPFPIKILGSE